MRDYHSQICHPIHLFDAKTKLLNRRVARPKKFEQLVGLWGFPLYATALSRLLLGDLFIILKVFDHVDKIRPLIPGKMVEMSMVLDLVPLLLFDWLSAVSRIIYAPEAFSAGEESSMTTWHPLRSTTL